MYSGDTKSLKCVNVVILLTNKFKNNILMKAKNLFKKIRTTVTLTLKQFLKGTVKRKIINLLSFIIMSFQTFLVWTKNTMETETVWLSQILSQNILFCVPEV